MADLTSFAPRLQAFSARLDTIRSRGQASLRTALGSSSSPKLAKALPSLQGEALARHHLALAIEAMRGAGVSKPEGFRKVRLLLNTLEQGARPLSRPSNKPVLLTPPAAMSRRARLLNKAFESAQLVSAWRSADSAEQSSQL